MVQKEGGWRLAPQKKKKKKEKRGKPRKNLASQMADAQAGMASALAQNQPAICREVNGWGQLHTSIKIRIPQI